MKKIILFTFTIATIFAVEIDFNHNGWDREAYLFKPSCIPDDPGEDFEPVPLVMMFHGLGGVGADNYAFSTLAQDSCFIVAFPSGLFNTWNVGPEASFSHDVDDNSYVEALIDTIYDNYPIDTNRIYGTGHSMGGAFTNHLACTSTEFTALGSSGGWLNASYDPDSDYFDLCDPFTIGYSIPTIHSHGMNDQTIPVLWGKQAAASAAFRNHCSSPMELFQETDWDSFNWEDDVEDLVEELFSGADTLQHTNEIHRYQWSSGCHTEPNTEVILLPNQGHAWHQTWNSPISTPLQHWNFFRQFSKDKMGPVLDSLALPASETLDDDYYDSGQTTPIGILAVDNYSVASMTISFSGFINVEGFDLTLTFETNERLLYGDAGAALDADIPTDSYETVQVSLLDHDGNEKVYDLEALQQLGLHQQMAVVNNITSSMDNEILAPEVFTLHQNYPNPFNPETNISYDLPEDGFVSVNIYDLRGTLIKTLANDFQSSGYKTLKWNGTNDKGQKVSAGLYLYQIQTDGFTDTKKMALLK